MKELASVERAEVYWMSDGAAGAGRLVAVVHGKKPTPCHRLDIVPLQTDSPLFAVVWSQDGDLCITRETPYSYGETLAVAQRVDEITLLCSGADGKPEEKRVTVGRLEPNSLRNIQGSSGAAFHGVLPPLPHSDAAWGLAGTHSSHLLQAARMMANQPITPITPPRGGGHPQPAPPRDNGSFGWVSVSFYATAYAGCQIIIPAQDGNPVHVFHGRGGGGLAAGGYTGNINTDSLSRLVTATTSCALVAVTFYGHISFFDAGANVIGTFDGGGFGFIGGGGYVGRWDN